MKTMESARAILGVLRAPRGSHLPLLPPADIPQVAEVCMDVFWTGYLARDPRGEFASLGSDGRTLRSSEGEE